MNKYLFYYHSKVIAKNSSSLSREDCGACSSAAYSRCWLKEKKKEIHLSWKCSSPKPFRNVFSNVFWRSYCAPINPNYRNYCREFITNGAFLWGIRFVFSIPITFQYSVFAVAAIVHRCFVRGPGVLFHFFFSREI